MLFLTFAPQTISTSVAVSQQTPLWGTPSAPSSRSRSEQSDFVIPLAVTSVCLICVLLVIAVRWYRSRISPRSGGSSQCRKQNESFREFGPASLTSRHIVSESRTASSAWAVTPSLLCKSPQRRERRSSTSQRLMLIAQQTWLQHAPRSVYSAAGVRYPG